MTLADVPRPVFHTIYFGLESLQRRRLSMGSHLTERQCVCFAINANKW
jgi:hypothetical protein